MVGGDQADVQTFIATHAAKRFQLTGPLEFEWVVRELFLRDGYTCTPADEDDGASGYFMAEKDGSLMVVMPVLAVPGHEPDTGILDRAVQLRDIHEADYVSIVTNGDFKPSTMKRARRMGLEAWDWTKLEPAIRELFFEGADIPLEDVTNRIPDASDDQDPELRLAAKWEPRPGVGQEWYNLEVSVTNLSDRHRYLHLELPVLVDIRGRQIAAGEWDEEEFTAGTIYSGATVVSNALFPVTRVGDKPPAGRVMLSCHERLETPVTYHLAARLKGDACFAVTYCFSRESEEYWLMTQFRDERLLTNLAGRAFTRIYYGISPDLIHWVACHPRLERPFRLLVSLAIGVVRCLFQPVKPPT